MKIISVLVFAVILLYSISAIGQINPDDRFGTYLNFESGDSSVVSNGDTLTLEVVSVPFGIPIFEKVANPDPNPWPKINNSPNVGKITTTADTWELVFVNNEFIMDFSVRTLFQVDVYSPAAGRAVLFRIEVFDDNTQGIEILDTTTVANEWETLTFDFSGTESGKYGKIVLFMDFGGTDVGDVWYFDNVVQAQPPIRYDDGILVDFENKNPYWFNFAVDIVENYTGGLTIIDNPYKTGINTSEKVGSFITTDAIVFDGAVVVERYVPFDLSQDSVFKIKVYPPAADLNFLLQLEHFDNGDLPLGRIFVVATSTLAFEWEELTFDFGPVPKSLEPGFYSKIVVMPDAFGVSDNEEWLFDDIIFEGKTTSVISPNLLVKPTEFALYQNYPNPFNPQTSIKFALQKSGHVRLVVYNIRGQKVAVVVDEIKSSGIHQVVFDAKSLSSGVYYYRLETNQAVLTKKMILLK